MRTIKWTPETGFARATHEGEIEVENNATVEEIEELAKEEALDSISWTWEEIRQ
jgi:hypothetical protein